MDARDLDERIRLLEVREGTAELDPSWPDPSGQPEALTWDEPAAVDGDGVRSGNIHFRP